MKMKRWLDVNVQKLTVSNFTVNVLQGEELVEKSVSVLVVAIILKIMLGFITPKELPISEILGISLEFLLLCLVGSAHARNLLVAKTTVSVSEQVYRVDRNVSVWIAVTVSLITTDRRWTLSGCRFRGMRLPV